MSDKETNEKLLEFYQKALEEGLSTFERLDKEFESELSPEQVEKFRTLKWIYRTRCEQRQRFYDLQDLIEEGVK